MKWKGALIAGGVVLLILLWMAGSYNSLVGLDESVQEKWGNVQTAYQRRADLIPNLVEVVKQYAAHEKGVFTAVTEARAAVLGARSPSALQAADKQMTGAITTLLAVAENYPQLKANENFLSLQDELAGTENRIKTERDIYNGAVKGYNTKVRQFPSNMIAGAFGFSTKESFAAEQGAENAPEVKQLFS